jgi:hypothetical protein
LARTFLLLEEVLENVLVWKASCEATLLEEGLLIRLLT